MKYFDTNIHKYHNGVSQLENSEVNEAENKDDSEANRDGKWVAIHESIFPRYLGFIPTSFLLFQVRMVLTRAIKTPESRTRVITMRRIWILTVSLALWYFIQVS